MWDTSIWDPPPLPHNPTTRATPHRTRRPPGHQPQPCSKRVLIITLALLTLRATELGPKGAPLPLTPKSVRRPWGLAECSLQSWLPVPVVIGLPGLGPLRAPQILESGSAWLAGVLQGLPKARLASLKEEHSRRPVQAGGQSQGVARASLHREAACNPGFLGFSWQGQRGPQ